VGFNYNGSIANSHAAVDVTGPTQVGGLVGYNSGPITNSYATGKVTGAGNKVGGLVGYNYKYSASNDITNSYATGEVSGLNEVGGLVGYNQDGTITNSYATGKVTGTSNSVGGLVGSHYTNGTISLSYAGGEVSGVSQIGGLVGYANSPITDSYATGKVTGTGDKIGGLVGQTYGYAVTNCYAIGNVTGASNVGGLVGFCESEVNCCTFNSVTTTQAQGLGNIPNALTGTSTADMKKQSTFTSLSSSWDHSWNFDNNTWKILEDKTYPYLPACQSNPAVITKAVTSGVTLSLAAAVKSVKVYNNGGLISELGSMQPGNYIITLTGLAVGNNLTSVVYETGKAPSHVVSAKVLATVSFTITTEDNATTTGATVTLSANNIEQTAENGEYAVPAGKYAYTVSLPGYKTVTDSVAVPTANESPILVTLRHYPKITGITPTGSVSVQTIGNNLQLTFNRPVKAVKGKIVTIQVGGVNYRDTLTGTENIVGNNIATIPFLAFKDETNKALIIESNKAYTVTVPIGAFESTTNVNISDGGTEYSSTFTTKKVPTRDDVTVSITSTDVTVTPKANVTGLGAPTVKYTKGTTVYTTFPADAGAYTLSLALAEGTNYSATEGYLPLDTTVNIKKVTFNVKDGDGPTINNATVTFNEDTVRTGSSGNYPFTYISSYKPFSTSKEAENLVFLAGYTASLAGYQAVDSATTFTASARAAVASGNVNITLYRVPRITDITPRNTVATVTIVDTTLTLTFDRTVIPSFDSGTKLSITKSKSGTEGTYIYTIPGKPTSQTPPKGGIVFSGNKWDGTSAKIPFKAFKKDGTELKIETGYTYTLLADSGAFTNGALSAKSDTLKFTTVQDTLTVAKLGLKDTIRSYSYVAAIDTAFKRKAALPADPVIQYINTDNGSGNKTVLTGTDISKGLPAAADTFAVFAYVEGNVDYKPATFKLDTIVIHKVTFTVVEDNAYKTAIDGAKVFFKGDSVETVNGTATFTYIASHFGKGDITAIDRLDKTYTYKVTKDGYLTVPPPAGVVSDTKLTDEVEITLLKTNAPPKITRISPEGETATVTYGNSLILYFDRSVTVNGGTITISKDGGDTYTYSITNASIVSVDKDGVCTAKIPFTAFRTAAGAQLPTIVPDNTVYTVNVSEGAFKSIAQSLGSVAYTETFTAVKANLNDAGKVTYSFPTGTTYTGKKLIPTPKIEYSGVLLTTADYDTTATGANTRVSDAAFIKIKAKGPNYTGELTLYFKISKATPIVTFPTVSVPYNYHDFTLSNIDIKAYGTGGTDAAYGTFSWKNPSDKLPSKAGTASYAALFTATDTANYDYSQYPKWKASDKTIEGSISVTLKPADGDKEEGDEETSAGYKITLASIESGLSLSPDTSLWMPVAKGGSSCFDVTGVPTKRGLRVTITGVGTVDGVSIGEGKYNICINGIGSDIKVSIVTTTPSDAFDVAGREVRIYPNPVKDAFTVDNGHGLISKVVVNDLSGRRVAEATPSGETSVRMNASAWAPGVYIITVESEGSVRRMKVVKR
jgi:hypothetical protein